MRAHICVAIAILGSVGMHAQNASAANQFKLDWHTYNHPNSCLMPGLVQEGQSNFYVDQFPIPTYTVGGSLVQGASGSFTQDFRAAFSGTLFRVGSNDIEFAYSVEGLPACVESDETVRLRGPGIDRLLFQVQSAGAQVDGATDIDLSLREIDPNLADAFDNLERSIHETGAQLRTNAEDADYASVQLDELQAALDDLLNHGFDEISPESLDALLAQYDALPAAVRDSLVTFLRDLQGDIAELRAEIDRVAATLGDRVRAVDGIGDGAPGFDPQDSGGFTPIATDDPPPIDIPEVLGDDPWSDSHDPYVKYADEVLATLQTTIDNGAVVKRATFLEIHGAWVYNIHALENILQQRATVTVREWGAFLDAKARVLSFFEQFIDGDGWMRDAQVTPELRALIRFLLDLDAAYKFKQRAEALQLAVNLWNRDSLNERQNMLLDVLLLFDQALRARMAEAASDEREDRFWSTMEAIADGVIVAADLAVSFSPVGHLYDLCRAVTGKAQCLTGDELSTSDRVIFAASSVIGGGAVWKAAASKLKGAGAVAVRKLGEALEALVKRTPKEGIVEVIPHAGGAKTYIHKSGIAVRYSREGFPDFSPYIYKGASGKGKVKITLTGSRSADAAAANAAAGFKDGAPAGFVWHHVEEVGTMMLVDESVHKTFAHTGGFAVWKKLLQILEGG